MHQVETGERDDKHNPARELVEETERFIRIPILYAEAGADDADNVGGNGDRDAGKSKNDAALRGLLEKVSVEDSQGEQAHQRAYTAARFGDLQLHDRKFDDVAFVEGGDAEYLKDVTCDP